MRDKVIAKAISVAESLIHCPVGRSKHFSFIVRKNNIYTISWNNSLKTHPLANKFGYRFNAIHSELSAIISFNDLVNSYKYEFLNIRFYNGKLGISRPCDKCQKLLIHYGFNIVTYSDQFGNFKTEKFV
jgi:tRNA(Arg) A34 adenosine deaminase TadA